MKVLEDLWRKPRIDCTTISLNAAANGLYTLQFKVYVKGDMLPYESSNSEQFSLCLTRERKFVGVITQQIRTPSIEFKDISEFNVSAFGFVCSATDCFSTNC